MNTYSNESAEEMHAALLDIRAFWENGAYSESEAGEMMYARAREALEQRGELVRLFLQVNGR